MFHAHRQQIYIRHRLCLRKCNANHRASEMKLLKKTKEALEVLANNKVVKVEFLIYTCDSKKKGGCRNLTIPGDKKCRKHFNSNQTVRSQLRTICSMNSFCIANSTSSIMTIIPNDLIEDLISFLTRPHF